MRSDKIGKANGGKKRINTTLFSPRRYKVQRKKRTRGRISRKTKKKRRRGKRGEIQSKLWSPNALYDWEERNKGVDGGDVGVPGLGESRLDPMSGGGKKEQEK